MAYRYKAFISYSWADRSAAEWAHRALETYRPPKTLGAGAARLHPIFRDREEEAAGRGIGAAIEEALDVSEFLIVLCSPHAAKSQWVNREIAYFKKRRDPDKVLALIVGGEPGRPADDCFPRALTHKAGEDYQPTEEAEDPPLAADARKEGDGKRRAKLKIAAAMLGVGLDDLVRRDERRRNARRRWAMSGMTAGMAVFGGLSLYAFTQRDAAVTARNEAVKARDDAEGIIELILTDLKSDLEGFGTLKSVTMIGNRAIGYYEGQDVKALTPDQLGRRARVLLMLGEADNKRGDLTAALARYETAAATTSEQLARDPDNAQRIFDHAQSVFWVGYIAWQRGDHAKAKAQFTEYHRHATRLVEIDPANDDWQAELEYAYSNLGTLAMDEGEAAEAEGWFRKSVEITAKLLERQPDDVDLVISKGQSLQWLADALHRQAKFSLARSIRASEIALYARNLKVFPGHLTLRRSMSVAHYRLAQIEIAAGQVPDALLAAKTAVQDFDRLQALETSNADTLERASTAYSVLGEINASMGQVGAARDAFDRSLSIAFQLSRLEGATSKWIELALARPKVGLALLAATASSPVSANKSFFEVENKLRSLIETNPHPIILREYFTVLAARARLDGRIGGWQEIIERVASNQSVHGPETMSLVVEAHMRLGNKSEAEELASYLLNTEFRHPDFLALLEEFPDLNAAAERRVH